VLAPASHQHFTPQTSPSPTFRGAPLHHTDLWHLSLRNYFCGAENTWNFLRRRRCGVQDCLKKRDKAEKAPIALQSKLFLLYIFSSFLHEASFSFFERKSRILLRRNSFCKGRMPKILRNNLLRTFLCTFSTALAFQWINRCKVVFQCNSAKFTLSYAEAAADTSGFADTHNVFTFIF